MEYDEEYTGQHSRTFGEMFKEHVKDPSPIHDHFNTTNHPTTIDNFSIVGREDQNLIRTIKEALYIRVSNPSLNKNIGKYHLPHIWDEVLFNTSELKLNKINTPLAGLSICHHGNNICHLFSVNPPSGGHSHLPIWQ